MHKVITNWQEYIGFVVKFKRSRSWKTGTLKSATGKTGYVALRGKKTLEPIPLDNLILCMKASHNVHRNRPDLSRPAANAVILSAPTIFDATPSYRHDEEEEEEAEPAVVEQTAPVAKDLPTEEISPSEAKSALRNDMIDTKLPLVLVAIPGGDSSNAGFVWTNRRMFETRYSDIKLFPEIVNARRAKGKIASAQKLHELEAKAGSKISIFIMDVDAANQLIDQWKKNDISLIEKPIQAETPAENKPTITVSVESVSVPPSVTTAPSNEQHDTLFSNFALARRNYTMARERLHQAEIELDKAREAIDIEMARRKLLGK